MDAQMSPNAQPPAQKKNYLPTLIALLLAIVVAIGFYFYLMFAPSAQNIPLSSQSTTEEDAISVLQNQQLQLAQEMATLRAAIPQTVTQTARMEILYYLRLADTATTVLQDIPMALQLLQRAKVQIDASPELNNNIALQQALTEDVAALEGVHLLDMQALAQTIATLEKAALALPFKDEAPATVATEVAPEQPISFWKSVWQDIGTVLQYVVHVNRSDTGGTPYFLFPEQKALLREQMRVQLEQLLLAAMGQDTLLYQNKLKEIQNAVSYFFDADQEQTVQFSQQLDALANEVLVPILPQANKSLLLLERNHLP